MRRGTAVVLAGCAAALVVAVAAYAAVPVELPSIVPVQGALVFTGRDYGDTPLPAKVVAPGTLAFTGKDYGNVPLPAQVAPPGALTFTGQ
jgi:hypothetical protein